MSTFSSQSLEFVIWALTKKMCWSLIPMTHEPKSPRWMKPSCISLDFGWKRKPLCLEGRWVWWENGYMYMYDWVCLLSSWNYHNIVNQQWKVKVAQSCLTLCDTMDCSLSGSSVHGILHARILEWVAIPFSRGSSQPRDWTQVSWIASRFFTV